LYGLSGSGCELIDKERMMRAIIQTGYGVPSEVLEIREVEKPAPKEGEVLIKVQASSVTFGDLSTVKGEPWIARFFLVSKNQKSKHLARMWLDKLKRLEPT
jgi:hypothetical protein